ncbi:thermonuclease family protein [Candidatus Methylospira mobilis]|uniref:thermonuclease family protein n=1 Tax=Candidatus Methylospira mobilis TaxID=1808979 RepID=UPI0018849F3C|nr:thermonuclease family protein [Candidatus Methylospira mobilis]
MWLSVLCGSGCADVYRWQDTRGQTHYSDQALAGAEKLPIVETQPATNATGDNHIVSRVYDGDTVTLDDGSKVRLLGLNTPEIEGISKHDEPGGQTARAWLKQRIEKKVVRIKTDTVTRDKYQRLLAHIFTLEDRHINLELVEEGLAATDIHPPNLAYVDALVAAEKRAQNANKGLWALPEYQAHELGAPGKVPASGWQRLSGTISATEVNPGYQSCRLAANGNAIEIRVDNDNLPLFPPLSAYKNHRAEARGWPKCRQSGCFMYIKHPSALIVLD